jgi:hypothetical protein
MSPGPAGPALTNEHIKLFKGMANFFKAYLSDNPLIKWSIVLAGIGGAFETMHNVWLFLLWFSGRLPH